MNIIGVHTAQYRAHVKLQMRKTRHCSKTRVPTSAEMVLEPEPELLGKRKKTKAPRTEGGKSKCLFADALTLFIENARKLHAGNQKHTANATGLRVTTAEIKPPLALGDGKAVKRLWEVEQRAEKPALEPAV